MPEAITASSQVIEKAQDWTDKLDAEPLMVADSKGRAVVTPKRQAQEQCFEVGTRVAAKRQRKNGEEKAPATITDITDEGVLIKWDQPDYRGNIEKLVSVLDLELPKVKAPAASSQDIVLPSEAIKWSACSTATNLEMLATLTTATLYQAYVNRSSSTRTCTSSAARTAS